MASDAWKGLIFSLMAGNRNAEALAELEKIPPDVRKQLEADIEFVQGVASLYVAVGDSTHATEYLNRVENYYLLHRSTAPAGLEIQHAWLLYNMKDDIALYPVLLRLDSRQDLTSAQREQVEGLWAEWAVRRAETAMDDGNLLRGVEILQAAAQDYPDNLEVRRAVAGAYARVGRATDAVTLFKSIPMDNASSGDYQGAISAALGATDMVQAEAWLRQALALYPRDPQILGLAARFEQARGNNERAADFWRAALAAMPPGAAMKSLDSGLVYPPGSYRAPAPGDTRRLLDPRNDPLTTTKLPPLPAYAPPAANQAPVGVPSPAATPAPQHQWLSAPSRQSAPTAQRPGVHSGSSAKCTQGTPPGNAPIYIPQSSREGSSVAQPVLIQQSWTQEATPQPSANTTQNRKKAHAASRAKVSSKPQSYSGRVNLPPSEQTINSAEPESTPAPAQGLRISSEPMGTMAAQVQALFADQTDSQLTQGSASVLRGLPNVPMNSQLGSPSNSQINPQLQPQLNPPVNLGAGPSGPGAAPSNAGQLTATQYTPSAQEAATGAYSVPKQQTVQPEKPAAASTQPNCTYTTRCRKSKRAKKQASRQTNSTLGNTPALKNAPETPAALCLLKASSRARLPTKRRRSPPRLPRVALG